jgi:biopolymer transport protein ExbD
MPLRRKLRGGDTFNLNLTPLLDVVLQLITFFMMLIHFGTKLEGATKEIRLPVAPAALPGSDLILDRLVVSLDRAGRLVHEGHTLEGAAADTWWDDQAKLRLSGQEMLGAPAEELATVVIIRADKAATYGMVRRALASAQERGFAHFSLVVLRSGPR